MASPKKSIKLAEYGPEDDLPVREPEPELAAGEAFRSGAGGDVTAPDGGAGVGTLCETDRQSTSPRRGSMMTIYCSSLLGFAGVCALIGVGMALMPPELDTDFSKFTEADTASFHARNAFGLARAARTDESRRLSALIVVPVRLALAYVLSDADDKHGIMTASAQHAIRNFEARLKQLPTYKALCDKVIPLYKDKCLRGETVTNFVFATRQGQTDDDIVPTSLDFDGASPTALPMPAPLTYVEQAELTRTVFPKGANVYNWDEPVTSLRSVFTFVVECCPFAAPPSEQKRISSEVKAIWNNFLLNEALPLLNNPGLEKIQLYWTGNDLYSLEIMQIISGDLALAAGSITFVLIYLMIHTRSIILAFIGLITVFMSVPLAYVLFAFLSGSTKLNIATMLSLFLVVGLGADVVFVYTDFWRDSAAETRSEDTRRRALWTYQMAGKASLATTLATALSFFANLVSVLRPLREFGFFMGLCVLLVWILVPLMYLPVCILQSSLCAGQCACVGSLIRSGGKRDAVPPPSSEGRAARLTKHLQRWRKMYSVLPVVLIIVLCIIGITHAQTSSENPSMFPDDHMQSKKTDVFDSFHNLEPSTDIGNKLSSTSVCRGEDVKLGDDLCSIFWCSADVKATTDCDCFRSRPRNCGTRTRAYQVQRFVGLSSLPKPQHLMWNNTVKSLYELEVTNREGIMPFITDDWLMGKIGGTKSVNIVSQLRAKTSSAEICDWSDICFCGNHRCKLPAGEWETIASSLDAPVNSHPRALVGVDRRLALPHNRQTGVSVIFGLTFERSAPIIGDKDEKTAWSFNDQYEVSHPWAQRRLVSFCDGTPDNLRVVYKVCWIKQFVDWLRARGEKFPLHADRFDVLVMDYVAAGTIMTRGATVKVDRYLWVRNQKIKASYVDFTVDVDRLSPADAALEYRQLWDDYIFKHNGFVVGNAPEASHTSSLWVLADATSELISSTLFTLLLVVVLAFAAVLFSTKSLSLSAIVVVATMLVVGGLIFVIVNVMYLSIGPIEVIALIVFIGYSLTYSLHIGHHYGLAKALNRQLPTELGRSMAMRRVRVEFALRCIGGAIIGSAVTTVGCSSFLLGCTLVIFNKLGIVAITVTVLSVLMALVVLPAVLLVVGPLRPGEPPRCFARLVPNVEAFVQRWMLHVQLPEIDDEEPPCPVPGSTHADLNL
eukprot:TRINITY_DN22957_c0_g5_i1.p1 TRINITY_DN22957_c0_g5~~TRINITY_DN22957_c0_g5_i1.p1  ORF type:complete len:1206 (+),score=173.87 TRINITY_DN22957_c0_g5_i1:93-3620(+)